MNIDRRETYILSLLINSMYYLPKRPATGGVAMEIARENIPVNIEDEMKKSYMDYAMSVIIVGPCRM